MRRSLEYFLYALEFGDMQQFVRLANAMPESMKSGLAGAFDVHLSEFSEILGKFGDMHEEEFLEKAGLMCRKDLLVPSADDFVLTQAMHFAFRTHGKSYVTHVHGNQSTFHVSFGNASVLGRNAGGAFNFDVEGVKVEVSLPSDRIVFEVSDNIVVPNSPDSVSRLAETVAKEVCNCIRRSPWKYVLDGFVSDRKEPDVTDLVRMFCVVWPNSAIVPVWTTKFRKAREKSRGKLLSPEWMKRIDHMAGHFFIQTYEDADGKLFYVDSGNSSPEPLFAVEKVDGAYRLMDEKVLLERCELLQKIGS